MNWSQEERAAMEVWWKTEFGHAFAFVSEPSIRLYNLVRQYRHKTFEEALSMTRKEWSATRGMGKKCLTEFETILAKHGHKLK